MAISIRKVTSEDFEALYALGKNTPELKVSATEDFMSPEEFRWAMQNPAGVFLMAEEEKVGERASGIAGDIAGFLYANTAAALDRPAATSSACLAYLVVVPQFRRQGIASALYSELEKELRQRGIQSICSWANVEGDGGITSFLEKRGFATGHRYVWMDKRLD